MRKSAKRTIIKMLPIIFHLGFFCQQVISNIFVMTSLKAAAFMNKL